MTNQIVQLDNFIVTLFVIIDDFLKILNRYNLAINNTGRKPTFSDAEIIVLILLRWKSGSISWKSFYYEIFPHYYPYFKKQLSYKNFIQSVHRVTPLMLQLMPLLNFMALGQSDGKFYIDSCPIEVCNIKRASSNKVCKDIASRKKSTMGWFFGFKLHAVCNHKRQIVAIYITTAKEDDREPVVEMVKYLQGTIWADAGYIGEELRKTLHENGIILIAAPRKNMKKLMTKLQHVMMKKRQKIEQVFSVIKTRFGLNCSLARSINGVFAMLLSAVLWYQIKELFNS